MQTPLLLIPEFVIHQTLTSALTFVRTDYAANVNTPEKSWLYKVCQDASFQRFIAFQEAVAIICGPDDNTRTLEIELMFNLHKVGPPTIHITMPSEQTQSGGNAMSSGEDYNDTLFEDSYTDPSNPNTYQDTTVTPVLSRRFNTTYNIVVTSDNLTEVVFLYHFVRSLLISCLFTLNERGLQNISLGGQDIKPYSDLMPASTFMRAISMSLQYESKALAFDSAIFPTDFTVNAVPIDASISADTIFEEKFNNNQFS